ncbi:MAG: DUF4468 domain-containing protein [Cytophagia bacterium]|nr:DUF4468 domain-containing protein [Cytophagia bacterium]
MYSPKEKDAVIESQKLYLYTKLAASSTLMHIKKVFLIHFFISIASFTVAQTKHPLPIIDEKINFSEIVVVDSASQDELYTKAKIWLAEKFISANDVIQFDDKENGIVIGKGAIRTKENGMAALIKNWRFTVKIQVKDGKYKVNFYDIIYFFEIPDNLNRQSSPPVILDEYFNDPRSYRKNGTLKPVSLEFANDTLAEFNAILKSVNTALTTKLSKDDF